MKKRLYLVEDWALYIQALTHTSYAQENGGGHNERLEYMGDAALQVCTSELLYKRFPEATEGELSRMRKQVVNNAFLAQRAQELRLGEILRMGRGEAMSGGGGRESNLAGAYEALLGALYLHQGLSVVKEVVRSLVEPHLNMLPAQRNEKLVLHEWCQQNHGGLVPRYTQVGTSGPDHDRRFRMSVSIDGQTLAEGEGTSKKRAAMAAALEAVAVLRARGVDL